MSAPIPSPAPATGVQERSAVHRRLIEDLAPLAAIALTSLFHLWIERGHFHGYVLAFHDLGIISDWFTNAIYAGRPFWITDMAVNHMSVHFTPTVIALTPFYWFTQSQFALCVSVVAEVAAGLYIGHRLLVRLLARHAVDPRVVAAISTVVILFITLNIYVKTVIDSAHIESLYIPLALAFFYVILFTERFWLAAILALLALGVREEAGIYLGMQCLALWFVRRDLFADRRRALRLALALTVVSLAYVVLVVKLINPLVFGVYENHVQRGWGQWGNSWGEVVWHEATSPLRLARALSHSALLAINAWFAMTPWLVHPLFGLLINAPGVLLYTASPVDKHMLWFYNAAFLLPGFLLAIYLTIDGAARLWPRLAARTVRWRRLAPWLRHPTLGRQIAMVLGAGVLLLAVPLHELRNTVEGPMMYSRRFNPSAWADERDMARWLHRCPAGTSVATDFRRVVLLPNRTTRYTLRHAEQADVVLIFRQLDPFFTERTAADWWQRFENDPGYPRRGGNGDVRIYARPSVQCLDALP